MVAAALAVPAVATALTLGAAAPAAAISFCGEHRRPDPRIHRPRRGRRLGGGLGDRGHPGRRRLAVLGVHVRRPALDRPDTAGLRAADARRRRHGAAGARLGRARTTWRGRRASSRWARARTTRPGRGARCSPAPPRGPRPPCRAQEVFISDGTSQARVVPPNPPAPADDLDAWVAANIGPVDVTPVTSGFPTLDAMADAVSDLPGANAGVSAVTLTGSPPEKQLELVAGDLNVLSVTPEQFDERDRAELHRRRAVLHHRAGDPACPAAPRSASRGSTARTTRARTTSSPRGCSGATTRPAR